MKEILLKFMSFGAMVVAMVILVRLVEAFFFSKEAVALWPALIFAGLSLFFFWISETIKER